MKIKKYLFFCLFLGFTAHSGLTMAQQLNSYKLNWIVNEFADVKSQSQKVELFEEAIFDVQLKHMPIWNKKFAGNFTEAVLINPIYEPAAIAYDNLISTQLTGAASIHAAVVFEKKIPSLLVSVVPFRKNSQSGKIERLVSFDVKLISSSVKKNVPNTRNYAAHSVLKNGTWTKLGIENNGIYKIGFAELKKMGLNPETIDPRNIRIYGNGGGILPEINSASRYDDLIENPILVFGEADGKFNETDYVLFYAFGPNNIYPDTIQNTFSHTTNSYTLKSNYFITADIGPGKRIANQESINEVPNKIINTYNYFELHELNNSTGVNLTIKSGRERWGEEFSNLLSYDFKFTLPELAIGKPIKFRADLIGRSQSPANSSFVIKANGVTTNNLTCGGVEFSYDASYGSLVSTGYTTAPNPTENLLINITYNKPDLTATGYLNFIQINAISKLKLNGNFLNFSSIESFGRGKISQFNIDAINPSEITIWDITNKTNPVNQLFTVNNNVAQFTNKTEVLKEFAVFKGTNFPKPEILEKIDNQDLHALDFVDLIIIAAPDFMSEAERLAAFRRTNNNLRVLVITEDKIFNEFSAGVKDASAIRDFVKMFYDRAGNNEANMPKYLLLFGDGSYDNIGYVKNNTNFVTTFESRNSHSPFGSYVSDDFFGLLDETEGDFDYNGNPVYGAAALDVAVGRMPIQSALEARQMVDKLISYSSLRGDWKNKYVLVADDQDGNLHLNHAENHYRTIRKLTNNYNIDKIYLDAYPQISTPSGSRYPEVNNAINQAMAAGALVINYIGHGGEVGLAHEKVLTLDDIRSWKNKTSMPLLFTATCSISRWDDPAFQSAGEQCLLNAEGGAIAMFTTTRVVFANENEAINQSFIKALYDATNIGSNNTLGDLFRKSKNLNGLGLTINQRNFSLLGDPSLPFAIPQYRIVTQKVNEKLISDKNLDTLKAQSLVNIKGYIADQNGNKLNNVSGILYPSIFDKKTTLKTLGQDIGVNGSRVQNFDIQKNIIYKGKVSVTNGSFDFNFVVPKDISYQAGAGRLSYYAQVDAQEAIGSYDSIIIGGSANANNSDKIGPEIKTFLNSENFVMGGITNENPTLIVKLKDANGINTVGNGIGHNLTATITKDAKSETIDLNQYYESKLDSYQEGEINYPFNKLAAGNYTLKIKAWDVFNNSSESNTAFTVVSSEGLQLQHVLNYPNPFTTQTDFQFEHNGGSENLQVQVQIFTVSGKLVKTINQTTSGNGARVTGILWDGKDDFGDKIGRGVYVYRLKIRAANGQSAEKTEKLVLLN
jgi:hypothetical protein